MIENMNRILDRIDLEFVSEHPEIALDLIVLLREDKKRTKDYIHRLELLLAALLNNKNE